MRTPPVCSIPSRRSVSSDRLLWPSLNSSTRTILPGCLPDALLHTWTLLLPDPHAAFAHAQLALQKLIVHVRMCWLRTAACAWFTSRRMNETRDHGCLIGCPGGFSDHISHYLVCPRPWLVVRRATPLFGHAHFEDLPPRLGLDPAVPIGTTSSSIRIVALAYSVYHCVKFSPVLLHKALALRDLSHFRALGDMFFEIGLDQAHSLDLCKHNRRRR